MKIDENFGASLGGKVVPDSVDGVQYATKVCPQRLLIVTHMLSCDYRWYTCVHHAAELHV